MREQGSATARRGDGASPEVLLRHLLAFFGLLGFLRRGLHLASCTDDAGARGMRQIPHVREQLAVFALFRVTPHSVHHAKYRAPSDAICLVAVLENLELASFELRKLGPRRATGCHGLLEVGECHAEEL